MEEVHFRWDVLSELYTAFIFCSLVEGAAQDAPLSPTAERKNSPAQRMDDNVLI